MSNLIKLRLQLFADDGGASGSAGDTGADTTGENENVQGANGGITEPIVYSDDDISKLKEQWQKQKDEEYNTKLQDAVKSALEEEKRKAKLSKDELAEEEKKKLLEEIEALKNEKANNELKEKARTMLDENKLPNSFLSMVLGADEKLTSDNISALKLEFDKAVQIQVEERLKGTTPSGGGNTGSSSVDDEIAKALGI